MYRGRLVVFTVLRKARECLNKTWKVLYKSNGWIVFYGASLRKYVDDDVIDPVSSKVASEANISRATGDTSLKEKLN